MMRRITYVPTWRLRLAIAMLGLGIAGAAAAQPRPAPGDANAIEHRVPVTAVRGLLHARAFRLEEPFTYTYLSESPAITSGFLLVLEVDREAAKPRQVGMPVLFVGDTPAHLTHSGYPSGRIVLIVPEWVDLERDPVFFGSDELPERIDRARGRLEALTASVRAARPFPAAARAEAFAAGGPLLELADSVELFRAVADLIERYAPEEREWAEIYRTPVIGRTR